MNTDLSIGMVAEKNGFAGSKAFARVFKEQYGVLPSEYRKKN
jgi:AraC-like DNA-binding protein